MKNEQCRNLSKLLNELLWSVLLYHVVSLIALAILAQCLETERTMRLRTILHLYSFRLDMHLPVATKCPLCLAFVAVNRCSELHIHVVTGARPDITLGSINANLWCNSCDHVGT
jgi:hypothetical protein